MRFAPCVSRVVSLLVATACLLLPARMVASQGVTGTLIGTVRDTQGLVLPGAVARISSPALIGGQATQATNEKGQLRFPAIPPGSYALDIEVPGFATYHEQGISIGAGATIERTVVLTLVGLTASVAVEGAGSRIDARNPGFGTRFGPEDIQAIPTRRQSMFDLIRAAPGISPTSQGSSSSLVSAFGSGANENMFLIDGTNFTSTSNGVARSEPGIDFIEEIHIQSVGASAEFGGAQGAIVNVITKQGSNRFVYDASYHAQPGAMTSQPIRLALDPAQPAEGQTGYERARYRDFTTSLGGPVVRERLWFFAGYHYLRDYDSQAGTDPKFPRTYESDKIFAKLTWRLAPAWQLVQSVHYEHWVNPELPTIVKKYAATQYQHAAIPAITYGHLTHTLSGNTVWDVRAGGFVWNQESSPRTGDRSVANHFDSSTGVTSGAPNQIGALKQIRFTAKVALSHYRLGLWGADHEGRVGGQFDKAEHRSLLVVPTGVRFNDRNGQPSQAVFQDPSNGGGQFVTAGAFASDAVTVGNRLTINAGVRFDHSRAISQDLPALDADGHDTGAVISGLGTMYTWNVWSPRFGVNAKLSADGRTVLRASYGRFYQGVLTGEVSPIHPGMTAQTTRGFDQATGGYTTLLSTVDARSNVQLDPEMRPAHTDDYSLGVEREVGRRMAVAITYVRKAGSDFIGWTEVGGQYADGTRQLADGRTLPVSLLVNGTGARRFLLTNPDEYSMTYNGLVTVVEKRRADGWQAFGSYTYSRAAGLQAYSGTSAAGPQVSTVGAPPVTFAPPITFGRDPNDLTNADGRLPNDRPHMFRAMGSVDVPRTRFVVAANLQIFSGKPWAATAQVSLPQNPDQRILIEPRGTRRLSSQTLLDLRVSRTIAFGRMGRVELILGVLNALNDTAEEGLATDNLFAPGTSFSRPTVFVDPRRAMVSARVSFGR